MQLLLPRVSAERTASGILNDRTFTIWRPVTAVSLPSAPIKGSTSELECCIRGLSFGFLPHAMQPRALSSFVVVALATVAAASPTRTSMAKRATCTVNSVSSASDLSDCSAVVIEAFSVASGGTSLLLIVRVPLLIKLSQTPSPSLPPRAPQSPWRALSTSPRPRLTAL